MSVGEGGRWEGIRYVSNFRLLGYFLLVYFGGAILLVIVVTGGEQSQLLVQKLKLGL